MLTNTIMLTMSGHDILKPLGILIEKIAKSICDTNYHVRCRCIEYNVGVKLAPKRNLRATHFNTLCWMNERSLRLQLGPRRP